MIGAAHSRTPLPPTHVSTWTITRHSSRALSYKVSIEAYGNTRTKIKYNKTHRVYGVVQRAYCAVNYTFTRFFRSTTVRMNGKRGLCGLKGRLHSRTFWNCSKGAGKGKTVHERFSFSFNLKSSCINTGHLYRTIALHKKKKKEQKYRNIQNTHTQM